MLPTSHALVALRRRLRLAVRAAIPSVVLLAALGTASSAQTFFVDASNGACSNLGPGTEAQPYCSIGAAMAAHKGPGITIVVKPGVYREQLTVGASGAAGSPYVIQGRGPGVVIDGADDFANAALWTPAAGTTFLASSVVWAAKQVYVDGVRLAASSAAPDAMPAGTFSFVLGQGLYVNLGGDNPAAHATLVGHRNFGFNLSTKSFVTIDGFQIARTNDRGINMQNPCNDLTISNNTVSFAGSYGIQTVNGQRITITGNTVSDNNFHGIGLTAGASAVRRQQQRVVPERQAGHPCRQRHLPVRRRRQHDLRQPPARQPGHRAPVQRRREQQRVLQQPLVQQRRPRLRPPRLHGHGARQRPRLPQLPRRLLVRGRRPRLPAAQLLATENGEYDLWVDSTSAVSFVSDYNLFWNRPRRCRSGTSPRPTHGRRLRRGFGEDVHSKQAIRSSRTQAAADFHLLAGSPAIDAAMSGTANWPATDAAGGVRLDDPRTANTGVGPVAFADPGPSRVHPPLVDHAPVVTAPGTVKGAPDSLVTFTVAATDSDGDAITSLTMVVVKMPANSGATFTPNANNTGGTFSWKPTAKMAGNYSVKFVATNALTGSATTALQIKAPSGKKRAGAGDDPVDPTQPPVIAMSQGWPNPSTSAVRFALDLPQASDVDLSVYDMQGRRVYQESQSLPAGRSSVSWSGLNTSRQRVGTGMYFVRAQVGSVVMVRRVVRF
jgi:hypothetical protein